MRARSNVVEAFDRRPVAGEAGARAPDEVLVERARARVDVAANPVDVRRLQVRRGEHDPLQERRVEVLDVAGKGSRDGGGGEPAQLLPPRTVAAVEIPRPR